MFWSAPKRTFLQNHSCSKRTFLTCGDAFFIPWTYNRTKRPFLSAYNPTKKHYGATAGRNSQKVHLQDYVFATSLSRNGFILRRNPPVDPVAEYVQRQRA